MKEEGEKQCNQIVIKTKEDEGERMKRRESQ